ncbi:MULTISPECIES: AzlC family ABC transporter permease [Rhodococcus]|uniref:AzlC family ABC transporter permease n=1 Tax=Rhodococcus oxybenzonivorans TaxID=1990687 RepID=A0AAE4V2J0_9NOCA|nr:MULTISPECIES: AzlC family ABC transporter permease [Rhodococcus]MDV7246170.1 AzlC family ABC transporter permease [Rhodococcus oxybenzonivorans]MDV7266866.1 AzlC family ABC transporter permease [Rhodococcus oxybenzonivorans]MDV7277885.1 AzlC family ABC transporter permease [Rhodococcus oxybenzonivorans]MDV7337183.1 AzlC family ABC transporter permease [Rhodococcus oxybenzonivorans]MDV7347464.1 AzlC family ABC transporter permease [Rhodococcus oxybenzonivorans]
MTESAPHSTAVVAGAEAPPSSEIRGALRASLPVGIGLFPLGIALGVLVVQQGLSPWWALVFTSLIYAGSLEFVAVGLVTAMTPLPYIALTALLVNFRHVFYALSFPLETIKGRPARLYSMFALTDEAYAMAVTSDRKTVSGRMIVYTQLYLHAYWIGGAGLGAVAAQWIPDNIVGMEFALTALFVVLSIEAVRAQRGLAVPLLGVTCAVVARLVDVDHMLPLAMGAFVSLLVLRYVLTPQKGAADA